MEMESDVSGDRIRLQMATLAELGVAGPEGLTAERIARRAELPEKLVTSLYPDLATLLYESVAQAIEQTIGRAIDELPANLPGTARLGLLSHRLWGALQLPAMAWIFRLVDVEDDRHGAFEHLLEEMLLSRPRAAFRSLVAELVRSGDLRLASPEHKAYIIVALLFAYGLWYHYPSLYPLFTPQHPDRVVSHVLLVSLGTEAHGRIMAASSGRSQDGGR
jgi:AcrR family transcriptional regulator